MSATLMRLHQRLQKVARHAPAPFALELRKVASELRKQAQMPNPNNDAQAVIDEYFNGELRKGHPIHLLKDTADVREEQWHARNRRDDSYLDFVKPSPQNLVYASEKVAKAHPATSKAQSLLRIFVKDRQIEVKTRGLKDPDAAIGIKFKDAEVFDRVYDLLEGLKLEEVLSDKDYVEFG